MSDHSARLRFWARLADRFELGLITWRPDDEGQWLCFASNVGVPHVARGRTAADALKELVGFVRRLR